MTQKSMLWAGTSPRCFSLDSSISGVFSRTAARPAVIYNPVHDFTSLSGASRKTVGNSVAEQAGRVVAFE